VLNVLTGKRYETITNEVKRYLQGGYGKAPAPVDSELQKRAIGKERRNSQNLHLQDFSSAATR
jgi:pyruvate carboxylase subunit B